MVIVARGATKDHAVRVESGGRDGGAAVLLQEAGIRLHSRQLCSVEVKHLDNMRRRSPESLVSR